MRLIVGNVAVEEKDHSKLPQDGQRLISYMENKFNAAVDTIAVETLGYWLSDGDMYESLHRTIVQHIIKHGKPPDYFAGKFIITNSLDEHKENMRLLNCIGKVKLLNKLIGE